MWRDVLFACLVLCQFACFSGDHVVVMPNASKDDIKDKEGDIFNLKSNFVVGFTASFYVIIISEIGDKTFFISAIMSMQHPRYLVYCGAMLALILMTVLSALLGFATTIIPRHVTYYASGVMFLLFGLKMMYEAFKMNKNHAKEEFDDVNMELEQAKAFDVETGNPSAQSNTLTASRRACNSCKKLFTPVFVEAFVLTFLAEWGDRSQLTTIALAATKNALGVISGGVMGHALCTGIAVLMGRFVAQRIPVQWITVIGGITFLVFAITVFVSDPHSA